jgi:hypothetical protein
VTAALGFAGLASREDALAAALLVDGVVLPSARLMRLARLIDYSEQARRRGVRRLANPPSDILTWIDAARDAGDHHEAVWRAFLGAHFGRMSGNKHDGSVASAARLLCAFGAEPVWTWGRVTSDSGAALKEWLDATPEVATLTFGNHRQHERPSTIKLMKTLRSFIELARSTNGPGNLIKAPGETTPARRFEALFRKLKKIHRFGRLGAWDFIDLLLYTRLITNAEPEHCYLDGATGPLEGARQIWGKRPTDELNDLSARFAKELGISCFVLEDALCNFQKVGEEPCCGDLDGDGVCP